MKKTTRFISLLLVLVLCLSVLPVGAAAAGTSGWKQIDGDWYYYKNSSPVTGWQKISGTWYWFDDYGVMLSSDWLYDDGAWYWFKSNGAMATSQWVNGDSGWYYQLSSGKGAIGWHKIGGVWYYFEETFGTMVTGGPYEIDGKVYLFKSSGALYTGWKEFDWGWAYFTSNGAVENGWKKIGSKYYYFSDFAMQTGWFAEDGYWYYLDDSSGAMATGWKQCPYTDSSGNTVKKWSYFKSSGKQVISDWVKSGGYWYYFDGDGVMVTGGPTQIGSYEYHFFSSGKMASNYWIHYKDSSGNWLGWAYYLSNGHRIQSGSIKLSGKWYYFSGGWCTNP